MCMTSYGHMCTKTWYACSNRLEGTRLNPAEMTPPALPRSAGTIAPMTTELEPREPDDLAKLQDAIRRHNSREIQDILRGIKPQIDGSFGPVNPRLIEVYFKGLAEIAKLYGVYAPAKQRQEEQAPEEAAAALQAKAEAQLAEIASRHQS